MTATVVTQHGEKYDLDKVDKLESWFREMSLKYNVTDVAGIMITQTGDVLYYWDVDHNASTVGALVRLSNTILPPIQIP